MQQLMRKKRERLIYNEVKIVFLFFWVSQVQFSVLLFLVKLVEITDQINRCRGYPGCRAKGGCCMGGWMGRWVGVKAVLRIA